MQNPESRIQNQDARDARILANAALSPLGLASPKGRRLAFRVAIRHSYRIPN
ncbi:hypothetical protein [Nostoc sp. KVJ20]|uniref:hypothetical protein n=1 Tax=Nostoc sp. KVJ20 TaxID=457944 RepID=UPI00159F1D70|nr:hypothetical protein [Nostoc sp. KVJ20]